MNQGRRGACAPAASLLVRARIGRGRAAFVLASALSRRRRPGPDVAVTRQDGGLVFGGRGQLRGGQCRRRQHLDALVERVLSDPQWISVDLGATRDHTRVVLNWEAAYGRAYPIQVSGDARTWTSIYSTTTGAGGVNDLAVSASSRYLRMNRRPRGTVYGYSLWELQVYGTSGAAGPLRRERLAHCRGRSRPRTTTRAVRASPTTTPRPATPGAVPARRRRHRDDDGHGRRLRSAGRPSVSGSSTR